MQPDRPLDYYVTRLLKQLDMAEFATETEVLRAYRYLAGDLIYKLTPLFRYRDGQLTLRFAAAALKHEMTLRRESLRLKLNDQLGGNIVKQIKIL